MSDRSILVIVPAPTPAWAAAAVADLRINQPAAQVNVATAAGAQPSARAPRRFSGAWRAGEPNPEAAVSPLAAVAWQGPGTISAGTDLVVDLTLPGSYRPHRADEPPVLRLRFGNGQATLTSSAYLRSLVGSPMPGRLEIAREAASATAVIEELPVMLDRTSWSRTRHAVLWKAAAALPRAVSKALTNPPPAVATPATGARGGSRARGAAVRSVLAVRAATAAAARIPSREVWDVAVQHAGHDVPSSSTLSALPTWWLGDGQSLADPCLVKHGERVYVFAERMRADGPACICAAELSRDGRVDGWRDVLVEPHHLSYPQVFADGGSMWLIPESSAAGAVTLYEAEEFPHRWRAAATLLEDVSAYDTTIHRNAEGYWLWTAVARHGNHRNAELWLFHSRALHGPWRAHPASPLITDSRRARPAGPLFELDGRLLRPAQDGLARYGHRIVINEVTLLSPTSYEEFPVADIGPEWAAGLIATHTFARVDGWQALDGLRRARAGRALGGSRQ